MSKINQKKVSLFPNIQRTCTFHANLNKILNEIRRTNSMNFVHTFTYFWSNAWLTRWKMEFQVFFYFFFKKRTNSQSQRLLFSFFSTLLYIAYISSGYLAEYLKYLMIYMKIPNYKRSFDKDSRSTLNLSWIKSLYKNLYFLYFLMFFKLFFLIFINFLHENTQFYRLSDFKNDKITEISLYFDVNF